MSKKKHEFETKPAQFDQSLYVERMERVADLLEENNDLLRQLIKAQEPKEEPATKTASKKATTTEKKDEPADDTKEG